MSLSELNTLTVSTSAINNTKLQQQESHDDPDPEEKVSKKTLRRLRRNEMWLANKAQKRLKEREKLKKKREDARLNNIDLGPSRKMLKKSTMAHSSCHIRVAVDMDFDDLMNPKDLGKCIKQLMRCYTLNRRAENPMQLYFTSFTGKCETEMSKNSGYKNWDVNIREESYLDIFDNEDIVYLTSESENILNSLDDSKVYIIGGLVDHNAHKGICFNRAEEKKISHAQLPISEYVAIQTRKVLTVDHVFEILLSASSGLSWKDAFLKVIPQRKIASCNPKDDINGLELNSDKIVGVEPELCVYPSKNEVDEAVQSKEEINKTLSDVGSVDSQFTIPGNCR